MPLGTSDVKTIRKIPVGSANLAYTSGDQYGTLMTLTQAAPDDRGGLIIQSVAIADKNKQDAPIDLIFFASTPTVTSVDNGVANITAANLHGTILGVCQVTSYCDLSGTSIGFANAIGVAGQPIANVDIYCLAVVRSAPTYTTTTALEFIFNCLQGLGR